jgi:hypothetical protein
VRPRVVRNLLSGTDLGHRPAPDADRPADRSVGDVGPAAEGAADLLVTAGVVAAVPTAAAGLNDWSDTAGPQTRVGLVHAAVNTTALSLYLASVIARARGRRRGGKALAPAGLGVLLGGGYLGGAQSAMSASPAHGPVAPSGSPMAASCAARPARRSPATRRASRTGVSRSAPSHRRCGPQPSAKVVTEDTVLRASNGPDRRGYSITERRIFCAAATSADYAPLSPPVHPPTVTFIDCRPRLSLCDESFVCYLL